jgi:hypothetical protein
VEEDRKMFLALIADAREEKRKEAYERLLGSKDPNAGKLAEAGVLISKVVCEGADPGTLERAIEIFEGFTMNSYLHGFMEAAGDVLLTKGLSIEKDGKGKSEMLGYGLRTVALAQGGGFPLSDLTLESVRLARVAKPELAEDAGRIIRINSMLAPKPEKKLRAFKKKGRLFEKRKRSKETVG